MRRKPLFPPPKDPSTGKRLANKGPQTRSVLTIVGRVKLVRRWWHSPNTGSVAPADELIDRSATTVTPGVRELACRENLAATSFDRAAANLARTAQLRMSGEQLRQVVEAEGRRVLAAQQSGTIAPAFTAADCQVTTIPATGVAGETARADSRGDTGSTATRADSRGDTGATVSSATRAAGASATAKTRLYSGCDGVMIPVITDAEKQKRREQVKAKRRRCGKKRRPLPPRRHGANEAWKELKLVYFYSEDLKHQHVAATTRNHLAAGQLLRREAERLGFDRADERVVNIDGALWIREQYQLHFTNLDGLGLDFYHLAENVHRARRAVFGEDSGEGQAWVAGLLHTFKHEGYPAAWQQLVEWRAGLSRARTKRKAADRLMNYVAERREMICYPRFRAQGWQIGSGPTESQCKLTTKRLKGHGRRWDRPNAAALTALDSLDRSGQWHLHFTTLHPKAA
jgi:hypothetical protein